MKRKDLMKVINHYGVLPQLKYFQSEVFELNEAIIKYEEISNNDAYYVEPESLDSAKEHIAEEIADVMLMLNQFKEYYEISYFDIEDIMKFKLERQLKRMEEGNNE